jgi:hypothetical protein
MTGKLNPLIGNGCSDGLAFCVLGTGQKSELIEFPVLIRLTFGPKNI